MTNKQLFGQTTLFLSLVTATAYAQGTSPNRLTNLQDGDVNIASDIATLVQVGSGNGTSTFAPQITSDVTLTADQTYFLQETVFVSNGATLTIEAGTTIYGASFEEDPTLTSDNIVGALVVTRGADLVVQGTPAAPVTMTTIDTLEALRGVDLDDDGVVASAPTQETIGRWGGLTLLGNAFVANFIDSDDDRTNGNEINLFEGSIEGFGGLGFADDDNDGFSDLLEFGNSANSDAGTLATNNAESSGSIQYLSIRHGGFALADGNEINGLTMGGIGSGTVIDHVEVVANADDGFEWFGGTVNTSFLVSAFAADDSFDIDLGHSGSHQFWFALYDSTDGDHAGEWDGVAFNDGDSDPGDGFGNSSPIITNATFLDAGNSSSTEALRFDDFFNGTLLDSAIGDFGVDETYDNTSDGIGSALAVSNNVFAGNNNISPAFSTGNTYDTSLNLVSVSDSPNGLLDPRPATGSPLLSGALDLSGFPNFENVSFRGAFDPDADLFIAGWTFLAQAGFLPSDDEEVIEVTDCEISGANFVVTFEATASTTYNVMTSSDLSDFDTMQGTATTNAAGIGTATIPVSGTELFVRIEEVQ